jgi:hypothetical protein
LLLVAASLGIIAVGCDGYVVTIFSYIVSGYKDSLSYRASHAVMVVSGIAAASSKLSDFGFLPTIRSSTR